MIFRKNFPIAICLIFLLISVSCSLFESKNNDNAHLANGKVSVSFNVQRPKSLVTSFPDGYAEIYQYKATLQSGNRSDGNVSEWTAFVNNESVGRFSKGMWKFEFRIICGKDESFGVIASGCEEMMLSGTECTVSAMLTDVVTQNQYGDMTFSILVSPVSDNEGNLEIRIDGVPLDIEDYAVAKAGADMKFTGSVSYSAGYHTVVFNYYDYEIDAGMPIVSSSLEVRFIENAVITVTGNLSPDSSSGGGLNVSYPVINATLTHSPQVLTKNTEITFKCNADTESFGKIKLNYIWYVNGVYKTEGNENTYKHTFASDGNFNISCVIWYIDESSEYYGSVSENIRVN